MRGRSAYSFPAFVDITVIRLLERKEVSDHLLIRTEPAFISVLIPDEHKSVR